ncbi:polysaccharide export protein [Alcanivorax sp. S6407]|uniref:polysaccharide export protein n=1 Tax=Alcanivorax sp. S6407 TaxID=2926424 RepID=UPI001FF5A573|nr:polysaccharide export protein [Alcanivorax sp. S6407]MCK0152852.1 polysaccharide export protein [Alcanivorax sp. S6407]
MNASVKYILVLALALMAGCTIVPGAYHSPTPGWFLDEDEISEGEPLPDVVEVHAIGTAILKKQDIHPVDRGVPAEIDLSDEEYDYQVGPGDVLQITVWDHPELTIPAGSLRSSAESGNWVHNDGTIFYPYVGIVNVEGQKVTEIRDMITQRLSRYIEDPQVDVSVAAFRNKKIYVTGEVDEPGLFPVTNVPTRLIDAIGEAGGLTPAADWSSVVLTRNGKDYRLSLRDIYQYGNTSQNVLLQPNDVINVNPVTDAKVFVLGEVGEAASLQMGRNGLTLAEALAENGSFNQQESDASGVFVFRKAPADAEHGIDIYQLNAKDAAALVLADSFRLQERDIVYVTAAPLVKWNRVLRLLVPSMTTLLLGVRTEEILSE